MRKFLDKNYIGIYFQIRFKNLQCISEKNKFQNKFLFFFYYTEEK